MNLNGCSRKLCPMQVGCTDYCRLTKEQCPYYTQDINVQKALNLIKTEVAREIFEEIEELAKIYTFPVVKNGVVEIAKEPFWCIEPNDLAELKKKYTEDSDES